MRTMLTAAWVLAVLLTLATGGSASPTSAPATTYPTTPLVGSPPLLNPGKMVAATGSTIPPYMFVDASGKLQGMRIELGDEIAKRLGIKIEWFPSVFEVHIPGLQSGRFDTSITGMFYTPERAKILYMIPVELQAISISVVRGNPLRITSARDLAGRRVAVEIGGYEFRQITRINDEQVASGLRPMELRAFNTLADAYQALRAGQVEAVVSIDVTAKLYQDRGEFDRSVSGLAPSPATLAFRSKDLGFVVLRVLNQMRRDGFYDRLFDKYGVPKIPSGRLLELKGPDLP